MPDRVTPCPIEPSGEAAFGKMGCVKRKSYEVAHERGDDRGFGSEWIGAEECITEWSSIQKSSRISQVSKRPNSIGWLVGWCVLRMNILVGGELAVECLETGRSIECG